MKSVVITGSTRGIGLGLAHEFLDRGCQVTINGRSEAAVRTTLEQLAARHNSDRVIGQHGDVSSYEDHVRLWQRAQETFGKVDIWINNAGIGHAVERLWELSPEAVGRVIDVDLKGVVFGSQVAIGKMLRQGHGHLYNMEGFGSGGRKRPGFSVYGSSKRALTYLTESLAIETKGTPVKVSLLSPGIVITDFIMDQYKDDPARLEQSKRIFNILADKVETVTPWMTDRVLANETSGAAFRWLTPGKIAWRFMTAPFIKRDLFSPEQT